KETEHKQNSHFDREKVIHVDKLKNTLKSKKLFQELSQYALVVFFTGRQLSAGFDDHNGKEAYNRILGTAIEELLHSIGVPHSNDKDDDVMKEFNSTNINLSENTKMLIAMSIFDAEEGCLSEKNNNVKLIGQDGFEKVVNYTEMKTLCILMRKQNETTHFNNFGFDFWAIDLGHEAFSQFEKQQVINVKQLKATFKSNAFFKEHSNYGLVALFIASA
ncbi:hypothetical protein TYRP_008720, partial [Tyrophagus putrescentiae]